MNYEPLRGLIAATHTPFDRSGALNLSVVEQQAAHLLTGKINTVFIGGSTGESHSLTFQERSALTERWLEVTKNSGLDVIVHVGSNCLDEAAQLARRAGVGGARAISMVAPSYFKPTSVGNLVTCCARVAGAAPDTPFYYYDIPALTGVRFPMPQFMEQAATAIPTFAGLKYTSFDLGEFQRCAAAAGDYDVLWGVDEFYLAALALGARGAIGSTYNFAPALAQRVEQCFASGDWKAARQAQLHIVQLVDVLAGYGYLPAAKSVMAMLGVEVGPARLPYETLTMQQAAALRSDLEALGFFQWVAR